MKRPLLVTMFLTLSAPMANADLIYSSRVEVRITGATSAKATPGTVGALPHNLPPTIIRTFVTTNAARFEISRPEGFDRGSRTVILLREGRQTVLDEETQTYWSLPFVLSAVAATPPALLADVRRTGDASTILGLKAERFTFSTSAPLPALSGGSPTTATMDGEVWLADAYTSYAHNVSQTIGVLGAPPGQLPPGMVLRQLARSAEFGYEVEYRVTELVEESVDPALFQVPDGYREVSAPTSGSRPSQGTTSK